jgi:hypothetical protein
MADTQKTLLLDVETSPNLGYVWGRWEQNIIGDLVKESQMISFAWKWLGDTKVECRSLPMYKTYKTDPENNKMLVQELRDVYDEADVVVGHNLFAFDDKVSNTNFIVNGILPPKPHRVIDTLKIAKKYFRFSSNKLGDLGKRLGLGEKASTGGFKLWLGCMHGVPASWRQMETYNKQDVVLLEKVYRKFLPWINLPKLKRIR